MLILMFKQFIYIISKIFLRSFQKLLNYYYKLYFLIFAFCKYLLRARPKAERVLLRIRENPEYERPAGRPAVVTLLRDLYLWNRKPD